MSATLNPMDVVCPRHMEPLRARWPEGSKLFIELLIQLVARGPEFANEELFLQAVNRRPLCCRCPDDDLVRIYNLLPIANLEHCNRCGRLAVGTSYKYQDERDHLIEADHLCYDCIVRGFSHMEDGN